MRDLFVLYGVCGAGAMAVQWRRGAGLSVLSGLFWPLFVPGWFAEGPVVAEPGVPRGDGPVERALGDLQEALLLLGDPRALDTVRDVRAGLQRLEARRDQIEVLLHRYEQSPHTARTRQELQALLDATRSELDRALALVHDLAGRAHLAHLTGGGMDDLAQHLAHLALLVDAVDEVQGDLRTA